MNYTSWGCSNRQNEKLIFATAIIMLIMVAVAKIIKMWYASNFFVFLLIPSNSEREGKYSNIIPVM